MHLSWEALARDRQGYAATNALMALTSALRTLPGKKAVVLLADPHIVARCGRLHGSAFRHARSATAKNARLGSPLIR
jgi:hypothetical protein